MRDRTVKITLQFGDGDVSRNDFVMSLVKAKINPADVVSIGLVNGRKLIWNITFRTEELAERYAAQGTVEVGRGQGYVTSLSKRVIRMKLLWLPYYIPRQTIEDHLNQYGELISLEFEKPRRSGVAAGPLDHAVGTTRVAMLKTERDPEDLPYRIDFHNTEEKVTGLVSIIGRRPKCFKCGLIGHERRECDTPLCTQCEMFGHMSRDCPSIQKSQQQRQPEDEQQIEQEERQVQVEQEDRHVQVEQGAAEVGQVDQGEVDQGEVRSGGNVRVQVGQAKVGSQSRASGLEVADSQITRVEETQDTQDSERVLGSQESSSQEMVGTQADSQGSQVGSQVDRQEEEEADMSFDSDRLVIDEAGLESGQRFPDTQEMENDDPPYKKAKV